MLTSKQTMTHSFFSLGTTNPPSFCFTTLHWPSALSSQNKKPFEHWLAKQLISQPLREFCPHITLPPHLAMAKASLVFVSLTFFSPGASFLGMKKYGRPSDKGWLNWKTVCVLARLTTGGRAGGLVDGNCLIRSRSGWHDPQKGAYGGPDIFCVLPSFSANN